MTGISHARFDINQYLVLIKMDQILKSFLFHLLYHILLPIIWIFLDHNFVYLITNINQLIEISSS